MLREELQHLQEQCSYVGEVTKSIQWLSTLFLHPVKIPMPIAQVVKPMDKKKVLVKVHPEGKFVVDVDKNIDINDVTPNCR